MTPEQLGELRQDLPLYAAEEPPSAALLEFCRFYGLDFALSDPGLRHRAGLISSGNFQLMTHLWSRPGARANLLLLHGYFDHTGLYDKLIAYGLSRNCNVLIFDLPGHGLSSGEPAVIDDFADYGNAIADVLKAVSLPELPLLVLGQSTGCAALAEFARRNPWPFARAALLAPLVRPAGWTSVRLGHLLLHRFTDSLARKFNANSSDASFLDFVQRDPLQCLRVSLRWIGALKRWLAGLSLEDLGVGPVLVVQGRKDGTVDWQYNMDAIARLYPGTRIHYLPDAGHQLANESSAIREQYYQVLDEHLFP